MIGLTDFQSDQVNIPLLGFPFPCRPISRLIAWIGSKGSVNPQRPLQPYERNYPHTATSEYPSAWRLRGGGTSVPACDECVGLAANTLTSEYFGLAGQLCNASTLSGSWKMAKPFSGISIRSVSLRSTAFLFGFNPAYLNADTDASAFIFCADAPPRNRAPKSKNLLVVCFLRISFPNEASASHRQGDFSAAGWLVTAPSRLCRVEGVGRLLLFTFKTMGCAI